MIAAILLAAALMTASSWPVRAATEHRSADRSDPAPACSRERTTEARPPKCRAPASEEARGPERRNVLQARRRRPAPAPSPRRPTAGRPRPAANAPGVLVDTTHCVGCRALRGRLRRGQRPARPRAARRRHGLRQPRGRPPSEAFTVVNRAERRRPAASRATRRRSACTASTPRAPRPARCKALEKTADGPGRLPPRALHRLPLLHDGLPVRRAEVRVREGAPRTSASAPSAPSARPRARSPPARRSARRAR